MTDRKSLGQPLICALTLTLIATSLLLGQAAPTEETEFRDLSETPIRKVGARIHLGTPGWNIRDQKASGPAVMVSFTGPAAPMEHIGKTVEPGLIRMDPEVQGEWKWANAQRLEFFPAAGWLPPGTYQFQARDGLLTDDCQLADNTHFGKFRTAPNLTAIFGERDYYSVGRPNESTRLFSASRSRPDVEGSRASNRLASPQNAGTDPIHSAKCGDRPHSHRAGSIRLPMR